MAGLVHIRRFFRLPDRFAVFGIFSRHRMSLTSFVRTTILTTRHDALVDFTPFTLAQPIAARARERRPQGCARSRGGADGERKNPRAQGAHGVFARL